MNTANSISINEYSLNTVTLNRGNTFQSLIVNCSQNRWSYIPPLHDDGQGLQSLYGVTIQSLLHGSRQGLTVSGRRLSGHLHTHMLTCLDTHTENP